MDVDAAAAAAQPLINDTHATTSPKPGSSAVLGANLLNAARMDYRHSSPPRMPRKPSNGRLSRVGMHTEPRHVDLARPRENVWDVPESPEKGPFALYGRVNRAPLKIRKKKQKMPPREMQNRDLLPATSSPQLQAEHRDGQDRHLEDPDPIYGSPIRSSPPQLVPDSKHTVDKDVQIQAHFPSGASRCTVTSYRSDKPAGPRYEQCHNAGTNRTTWGFRCNLHMQKPGSVRCEHILDQDGGAVQCRTAGVKGSSRCGKHTRIDGRPESTRKRKPDDGHDANGTHSKSPKFSLTKSQPEVHVPMRRCTKPKKTNEMSTSKVSYSGPQQGATKSIHDTAPVSPHHAGSTQLQGAQDFDSNNGAGDDDGNAQATEQVSGREDRAHTTLKRAFKFLDLGKRAGRCQTELCQSIRSDCNKTISLFTKHVLVVEDLAQNTEHVQTALRKLHGVKKEDRCAVKEDMYSHVFRSLTRLLRSLYNRLLKENGNVTQSLEAVRIVSSFIHETLATKDLIASWKVQVPQHHNGDRIIKDVDSHLIAPLRDVGLVFSKLLSQLEHRERSHAELAEAERKNENRAEEATRRRIANEKERDRWERWQRLHITRMYCEPDPRRRRAHLFISKLDGLQEKDANGVMFERVPVFKNRNPNPLYWSLSSAQVRPWSTVEETALIDGLKHFMGALISIPRLMLNN
jgi:hypothetical protein